MKRNFIGLVCYFIVIFLFNFVIVTAESEGSWVGLKVLDEVQLVDGTTWYVVQDSDETTEIVSLVPAYNLSESFEYDKLTDYVVPFDENDSTNTYYATSTIKTILDDGFKPVLLKNLNDNFFYTDGKTQIIVDELGIIGSNDMLRVAKAVNYEYAMNTKNNAENTGESVYIAPEWLYRESFWMAEDGWYSIPYTTLGLNVGYVKKATNMSTENYGIKPYIVISKKYLNGKYKITHDDELILNYEKAYYNEGERLNISTEPGYIYLDFAVTVNGNEFELDNEITFPIDYDFVMPAMDLDIRVSYSSKKLIDYNLKYELNGGTTEVENPVTYNKETDTFTLNNPNKEGYKFIGWSVNGSEDLLTEVVIEKGTIGDFTFVAYYEKDVENPNTGAFIDLFMLGLFISGFVIVSLYKIKRISNISVY